MSSYYCCISVISRSDVAKLKYFLICIIYIMVRCNSEVGKYVFLIYKIIMTYNYY